MKYYIHLITLSLLLSQEINFINSKLIDLQGINSDYDVVMDFDGLFYGNIYLTWINQQDSLYSVYSAQILVDSQDPVLIYSDTVPNIHPTIDNTNSENSLNIVWQSRVNNFWQLKRYDGATISTFSDSVSDNTKPSLSRNMLAWLNDDTIKVKCIDCPNDTLFIIDSLNCENPQIISYDDEFSWSVAYEKEIDTVSRVYLANYSKNQWTGNESFNIEQISGNFESRNPVFDYFGTLSYESLIDGYWKSIITWGSDTTRNQDYNCTNPMSFTYAYVNRDVEDCMFVYESDSIEGNNEIYYETEWYDTWGIGQRGNLSNMEGADTNPFITLIWDTVTVFWEHQTENGSEIWWAKDVLNPSHSIKDLSQFNLNNFLLDYNYPNPFNPCTNISYRLPFTDSWSFSIYDITGAEIRNIYNKEMSAGNHNLVLNMNEYSSGIYFYKITNGTLSKTKKFNFIK